MAQRESHGPNPQLDIQQLQAEVQHRWLQPVEICEILRNYKKFLIAQEPPNRPPSGSFFFFDRRVLKHFRQDNHNWRKRKNGKTVNEAHEKLKVGSADVLHCYYARGQENENFQRRIYGMTELDLMHIAFVHYLEVKSIITNAGGISESEEVTRSFLKDGPSSNCYSMNHSAAFFGNTDSTCPTDALISSCKKETRQTGSGFHSLPVTLQREKGSGFHSLNNNVMALNTYSPSSYSGSAFEPDHIVTYFPEDREGRSLRPEIIFTSNIHVDGTTHINSGIQSQDSLGLGSGIVLEPANVSQSKLVGELIISKQPHNIPLSLQGPSLDLDLDLAYEPDIRFLEQIKQNPDNPHALNQQYGQHEANEDRNVPVGGEINHALTARRLLADGEDSLKKVDSFSRWVSKELGDVEDLQMQSSSVEYENVTEGSSLGPSISHDQLFSIVDFSPKWAYGGSKIQVLVMGTFLKNQQEISKCSWSCMFGGVEVPAIVLADGLLSCQAPDHDIGRVPFYVTCSNRLACGEVREFDFRCESTQDVDIKYIYASDASETHLHLRLERLLSLHTISHPDDSSEGLIGKRKIMNKIIALKEEEDSRGVLEPSQDLIDIRHEIFKILLQKFLREKLYSWLLHKVIEEDKGPRALDDRGQGVLHLAAALGYDWAIKPVLDAGVSINLRDAAGWSALHWAAHFGRERTVGVLVSLGAATGVLTDPSPENPLGRTPADLASINGHKGISGFLAESSLTDYLSSLNDSKENRSLEATGKNAVQMVSERSATPAIEDVPEVLSWKDSLNAVCNATQAADRIHQIFRIQSFQRKKLEAGDDEFSDEHAISLAAAKTRGSSIGDGLAHTAAIQIQKKYRGWKKRKEFLIFRQRIVKIQAHVRGHQVGKQYRTIIWSVGILEKIILRWRRKGSGLRGYRSEALNRDSNQLPPPQKEDDYDFLKEGRKQTEERLQKALTRVKSMVQYPEARAQYRRLLNIVEGIRDNKACDMVSSNSTEAADGAVDDLDFYYPFEDGA